MNNKLYFNNAFLDVYLFNLPGERTEKTTGSYFKGTGNNLHSIVIQNKSDFIWLLASKNHKQS